MKCFVGKLVRWILILVFVIACSVQILGLILAHGLQRPIPSADVRMIPELNERERLFWDVLPDYGEIAHSEIHPTLEVLRVDDLIHHMRRDGKIAVRVQRYEDGTAETFIARYESELFTPQPSYPAR